MTITIQEALAAFVKADAKAHDCGTSYMTLAVANVWNSKADERETVAANLVADMCRATGSVGKVTKEFPNGKPNPQALKANGYSGLAEAARLLRKIAKPENAERIATVVEGFLGVIQNETQFEAHKAEDKRIVKALDSGDEAKLTRAEAAFLADYLALTYPDRPTSFSALRRALDKATTATGTASEGEGGEGEGGEGEGLSVNAASTAPLTLAEIGSLFIARLADATADDDDAINSVLVAITAHYQAVAATEEGERIAA